MKKRKKHLGIRTLIMVPVVIMGIFSILSNVMGFSNVQNVNNSGIAITNDMESISAMGKIQEQLQSIHKMALSHIIATKYDTMVTLISEMDESKAALEEELVNYQKFVNKDTAEEGNIVVGPQAQCQR